MSSESSKTIEELEAERLYAQLMASSQKDVSLQPPPSDPSQAAPGPTLPASVIPVHPFYSAPPQAGPLGPLSASRRGAFDPAFGLNDLVDVWYLIYPDTKLHPWQFEELLRMSGYVNGSLTGPRTHFFEDIPFLGSYVCCNGSGKDRMLISTAAIGLPLLYRDVIVVITSSSNEQLKFQTENHISRGIAALNKRLGQPVYESIHYYHRCAARGGEIKLFATDEAGRAEGWHPMADGGRLVIIVNEAKSITPEIFSALDRCHGYSHWLEISSPGPRRGMFYENFKKSIQFPSPFIHNRYFARRVDVSECPHISLSAQQRVVEKHGENSYIVQTSLRANFFEEEKDVVIPAGLIDDCEDVAPRDDTIGIGVDAAAGGDETSLYVRRGNRVIDSLFFREPNIKEACARIHDRTAPFLHDDYTFNLDDGGIGRGFKSILESLGWNVIPRHNQSAAYDKTDFSNLGAEMWWHVRDLFQARLIPKPLDDITYVQLATRQNDVSEGLGKKKLASKKRIKELGGASPDRADAFVLCYFSYKPKIGGRVEVPKPDDETTYSPVELERLFRRQLNFNSSPDPATKQIGLPTSLTL